MNKIFQEYFLDDPVFKLVAIQKSINKIFKKQLQRNPFLRQVVPNLSTESLKNTCKEICILESCSISTNKIFEMHLRRNSYFFSLSYSCRVVIKANILNYKKNGLKDHQKPSAGAKMFVFWRIIIAYLYLSRNPKFAMEAVN